MTLGVLFAAITIAFPKEGQILPHLKTCYLIGAADGGETNLTIQGKSVEVYRTGAWATMIDLTEGTNRVVVGNAVRAFVVKPAPPILGNHEAEPPRVYTKLAYSGDSPQPGPSGKRPGEITIVLDAGHGGIDRGATSPHGRDEKEANLLLARVVESELKARGFKVVMTRTDDSFPALYDRPKVAHRHKADAFVSIHHNAPPFDKDPREFRYHSVYCWNDLGERLAKAINARMATCFGTSLANNGVLRANFAVTRNPEIPSCLIEADFVTSPVGEEAIWNPECRRRTAVAIADGIADWTRL